MEVTAAPVDAPMTRFDAWWARRMTDRRWRRGWHLGGPLVVLIVSAITRLQNLGYPPSTIFDEQYYARDAWSILHLGYEGTWPRDSHSITQFASKGFTSDPNGFLTRGELIAHPPLGKWIIALGMAVFGPHNPVGWRISVALVGILIVALTMAVAHLLFRSTLAAVIAGGLIAIDGNAIVLSRTGLLDNPLTLLVLLGSTFVLLDRRGTEARLGRWRAGITRPSRWGPVSVRPWLLAAGVTFGAATGVKWSGAYVAAAFVIFAVIAETAARRRAGVPRWFVGGAIRQGAVSAVTVGIPLVVVYVITWTGWFVTTGGYDRVWIQHGGHAWTGVLSWVPTSLQNWVHYQGVIYRADGAISAPNANGSGPLGWLVIARPPYFLFDEHVHHGIVSTIYDIPNPLIWWSCGLAMIFVIVRLVRARDFRAGFIVAGFAGGYLPWFLYLGRTTYAFYTIVFEPFYVLGLTFALLTLLGSVSAVPRLRAARLRSVGVFLALCAALSAFWYPIWTGQTVPLWFLFLHYWFTNWM